MLDVRSLLSLYSMGDKVRYPALRPRHTRRARPVDCALSSARDGRAPRLVNGLRERLLLARAGHGAEAELAGLTLTVRQATLLDFGFSEARVNKALRETKNAGA